MTEATRSTSEANYGSTDVKTTRYTIKANIETTCYFNPPFPDIEDQVNQNTQDISDLKTQINLKENIADHQTDMTTINNEFIEVQGQINDKESILAHNTDISTLQPNIN